MEENEVGAAGTRSKAAAVKSALMDKRSAVEEHEMGEWNVIFNSEANLSWS